MFGSLFGGGNSKSQEPAAKDGEACPAKPKPCCVCKEEKSRRDECLLFAEDGAGKTSPEAKCADSITAYRLCMESFGFKLPESATS